MGCKDTQKRANHKGFIRFFMLHFCYNLRIIIVSANLKPSVKSILTHINAAIIHVIYLWKFALFVKETKKDRHNGRPMLLYSSIVILTSCSVGAQASKLGVLAALRYVPVSVSFSDSRFLRGSFRKFRARKLLVSIVETDSYYYRYWQFPSWKLSNNSYYQLVIYVA